MNALNEFLLSLFTGVDELRPAMNYPNLKDGIVYATDGHVLISIPETELSLKYRTNEKYPNTQKVINDYEVKNTSSMNVNVANLARELTKARIIIDKSYIKCDECNGRGEVEWEYEDKNKKNHYEDFECPICDGKCKIEEKHPFARISLSMIEDEHGCETLGIDVGHMNFHPFHLYRLFMVALIKGYETIELFFEENNYGGAIAYFGNIKVLIMPRLKY